MKIYQAVGHGGQWDDAYEYVAGTYLDKTKAQDKVSELYTTKEQKQQQYDKCEECPFSCGNVWIESIYHSNTDCELADIDYDEESETYYCKNECQCYTDILDESYEIKEYEVIE